MYLYVHNLSMMLTISLRTCVYIMSYTHYRKQIRREYTRWGRERHRYRIWGRERHWFKPVPNPVTKSKNNETRQRCETGFEDEAGNERARQRTMRYPTHQAWGPILISAQMLANLMQARCLMLRGLSQGSSQRSS